jgi:uncharacterized protein YcbK (DUF882 family)
VPRHPTRRFACDRRRLLGLALAGSCGLLLARSRPAAALSRAARRLRFHSIHTGESLNAVYWADGRYLPGSLAEINYHLRDFRDGTVRAIDPELLDLLHRLRTHMDYDGSFHVISGYRSPKTNAMLAARSNQVAKNSYHVHGMAIDLRLSGRPLPALREAALELAGGGVGYYPKSDFVHVDIGPVRAW